MALRVLSSVEGQLLDPDSSPHFLRLRPNTLRWLTFAGFGVLGEGALDQADQSLDFVIDHGGENWRLGEEFEHAI